MRFSRTAFVVSSIVAVAALSMQAAPSADTSDIFVAPMLGANWGQGSPMNDLTPRRSPCGCSATAGGQELRLWRWPYRFEKSRTFAHQYFDDDGKWTTYTIRLDGRVPLDWDKIAASGGASTPVASDKETAYNTAMLTAWLQSFAKISFKPGAGSANQKICSEAENWWYEAGPVMSRQRNGYDNLWTAITNDLAFGSPVQINTPVHQMVIDGYAVDNAGTADETRWINTNYGWGGAICWENFDTATTSGGSAGVFADFQTGYRPQKRVQFEPVPRVSTENVPLVWHLAPCYTNKIDGFTLEIAKFAGETQFADDFANSTGVASGEKFKVENGVLGGYPAIQTSYFTYHETYMATADSVLEFDVQSRYMSGHAATAEICANGGAWETAATIPLSAGKNAAFGTPTHQTVSLAAFAGRTVRLRFKLACTWAGYAAGSSPDFIIDNVSLSGVAGFAETETVEIERDDSTPGVYGYTASGLADGANYAFTVTPVMTDGSAARSNAATTRIGTPEPAPEILGVSSVACGLELVQDGFFIECARGIVNDIAVDCNAAAIDLVALPSHLSILPDEKISVEGENGVFTVHVDATDMMETGKFHDGDMLILTLVATNADGTEAVKNLMLRFNSMRQVMDGTFDVVDSDAATPVWFCGNTIIDAKGQTIVFASGVFQGTGNVTLTDSTGGGSFAFESLDGFTGTLAFDNGVSVSFPTDMTAFAGKISSDVTLESGETMKIAGMTPFAGGITLAGGTLKIALSDEDVAYGFSTSEISYITGSVVFVAPDGTETAATQTGSAFSFAGTANVWTGTDAIFGEKYSTQSAWSAKRLPAEGDYVVFNDASTDGNGALMALNLSSAVNLAYVKITGNSYFEIDTFTSDTTAKLSADVLENDIYTKLDKNDFTPKAVVPKAKLLIANGMNLACDIDYTLAQNLKTRNYTASGEYNAIQYDHAWNGTVVFENYTAAGLNPGEYGNAQSTVRFKGVTGWLTAGKEFYPAVELVDNGDTPALHWNDGSSSTMATFDALKGTGTFKTSKSSVTDKVLIKDVSAFAGSFNLAAKAVAIADSMPTENLAYTGRLLVGKAATIASGATWAANGGVYLGACELTVAGTLASPLTASAEGAKLTLADGGTVVASAAIAGGYSPSLDFKAGTYKIDADVRETNTVNFCAAEGDVTTLDANGHKMTLAESFFSGSGDITLVSSVAGGSFVIEGVSQDFKGTIRLDGEVNVSLPDDLSSIGGTIAISGASLAYSSAKLGPLSVGVGSTLTVSLTDREAMKGFSASSVTLDGGTIEFVDQYGTTVGSSTESTTYVKPDGYTLAPVPTAVWVSGEFEDEATVHGGYAIALNDNTVNDSGNVVIGSSTTLGAVIDIAAVTNCAKVTILAKIKTPVGGAPAANSVAAGVLSTDNHPIGAACKTAGGSDIQGYWLNGANANYNNDGYKFGGSMQALSEGESYMLFAFQSDSSSISPTTGTALYFGESFGEMSGGNVSSLQWRGNTNSRVSVGGPANSVASMNTVPWAGLEIEAVALFADSWLAPGDVALYEFPEAKAVVPSWAVASVTLQDGNVKYYRDITVAFYEILNGDIDADTVQVLDGSSVDYLGLGFEYDAATQTYSKIKTVIAKIDNGIILLEFTTLAAACEEADLQNIGVVELLAARDSISEAIPSGWSYVSPEDSGTEYGTILKTISEIPGTVSSIELTQENVSLSIDGEWAEVSTKPIYITLGSATNAFTLSFDADIPDGVYGTLLSWDSVLGTTTLDSRVVITNDAAKQVIWRTANGTLSTVAYTTSELIQSGEHYIELNWVHNSGATIKVDGETYYASGSLEFTDYLTSRLAFGGSALGSPDDVLAGLKVKNLNFRVGKQPTEPDEENENFLRLDYVTRLDGTVYHGNDVNRAIITNWQTQITGVAKRPVPEGKADADFSTIDVLFVYDTPGKAYVESNESAWNGANALEVYSAKATAKMNQILCTTDMDTNFWFRMVGVHTVDGTGGTLREIIGKCEGLTGEYKHMLELRDRYGADVIVCPSPNGGGLGGLARLNTLDEIKRRGQNAAYHFATVLLNYSQTHAWVHEIGHNMSLNHYPPANFDPANTWRGLGFQHKIAVDGTSMSSVMAEQGYADFCGGFSSKNHIYHGSRLSISNHLDSTGVLLEAAPYVSAWRSTRVPETAQIECSIANGSYLTGDTVFELSYPDQDAEIHYMVWGENNNEYQTYNGPFTVTADGKNYAYIDAYVITNGAQSATVNVAYNPFNSEVDTLLGSPKLPWTTVASIDGGWAEASGGEYLEVADSFTGSRTSESTLSTTVTGPDTLSFQHSELLKDNPYRGSWPHTFADSSFTVWVDNEPVYMLRGATNTLENWTTTEIAIPEGTHKVDFTYSHRSGHVSGETVRIKSVALASGGAIEESSTLSIADNATWNFAAGATRTYESIGALSSSGTIAVTNDTIGVGVYKLAEWTTPQTMSAGYGRVGTLNVPNLPSNLTAELVYGVNAIYLRVYDETMQFLKPTLKVWPYGDSITEGFNAGNSKANYRVLIGQKLKLLGYNVAMVGCYDKIQTASGTDNFMDAVDPSGAVIPDEWKWHSAKHGGTLGVTSVTSYQRSAMVENVDTLCAQAGNPDVVLLHGGINDLSVVGDASTVFANWTNVVWRILEDLPQTKIVVSTTMYATYANKATLNARSDSFNALVKAQVAKAEGDDGAFPVGRVYLADLNTYVKSTETGVLSSDGLHPDWWGHDQMAEGFLSQVTNIFTSANGPFNSYLDYVDDSSLGAAAKTELDGYRNGFTLAQTITVASTNAPSVVNGEGPATGIGKVGYFVEYVRADNEAHKWVWVDMDAFATTLADIGLPTSSHQQVVTSLHVMSNHNGIDDIAADDNSATGWIEFSPFDYTGAESGAEGAPAAHGGSGKTMFDWNDTLGSSGTTGSMQVFRIAPPSGRPAQALFAYNNWQSDSTAAEFGIGNFAQHFWGGAQTLDYTYTKGLEKMNASAYRVKRIEIWTKEAPSNNGKATVVRVHPRLTRGLAREALVGIRFDNALGGNASAFDVKFRLVNCTKADITDIKYWKQPFGHNYGFYEAEATQGPAATVSAAEDATEFTASFPAGSVWFYPQVGTREDSDYLWVTATINPEISPDAEIWVSVPTAKITLSNGGVFDVVNGAETQPHRVFPFVHQIGAYLRQDGTALTDTWAGKLEDSPANRVGNLTDIVVCNDFLVAYDSENDTFKTTWNARGRDNTAQVARIKALRDQYNPKCMIRASLTKGEGTITVDGVTGRPIACAAASAARRKQLIDSILAVMESAGLDGLDIDWEYPGDHDVTTATQRDWHSYGLLMRDLAAAFFDKGYVLSFCSNLGYQMAPSGYYAAFHAADFVNAMAYGNTPLNASPQVMMTGINVCTSRGVPSRRIVVGQAMYAYEVQNPGWGSVVPWLKEAWPNDNTRWWDADLVWTNRTATKADGTVLSTEKETFEGPASYHAKCNWCRANGYGGVMSWGYYTDVSWDDADLMSLARHQAKSCWPRTNWSWPAPPQDSDGAYLLGSEEDWFWLRDNPGVNARFAADIVLTHDPLPIETFSGTIDGAGHALTISNDVWLAYDSDPALVRTLTGTVKNLKIDLYGRVVSRASRWNDTTASKTANTLANTYHYAAVLAANLGAGGVIDGVELFIRPGAEVQGPQRVAGLAASVWVPNGSHAEIRNSSVHVDGVVRSLARNTAEGDITVANQCAGGIAGWVGCPGSRNIVVTNNIVSLASTGRVAVETGSSSSAGGVIGDLNNGNPLVQNNAVYVSSGARVSANESAAAGNVRTSYANASYSIASSANAGRTTFFIEDGAATLAGSVGGTGEATVEISSYGGEATDGISVDAVAGFWYSVIYGDRLVSGGIGGETGETEPVKAAANGPLALEAPKDGPRRFYRVKVSPVR